MTDGRLPTQGCPEPETLAAFIDGRLEPRERAAVEAHLADCEDCYEVWMEATAVGAQPATAPRSRRSWYVWAGVAAAVTLAVALPALLRNTPGNRPELDELAQALGARRTTTARLVGPFTWAAAPSTTRSAGEIPVLPPAADIAIGRLRLAVEGERSAENLAALGTARLLSNQPDEAIALLEEATSLDDKTAAAWSDLAAAYLERSMLPDNGIDVPRSVQAAERALSLQSDLPAAWFNLALGRERLSLKAEALAAWEELLKHEKDSSWAAEARAHISELSKQSEAPPPSAQALRERFFDQVLPAWAVRTSRTAAQTDGDALVAALKGIADDQLATRSWDHARIVAAEGGGRLQSLEAGLAAYGAGRAHYRVDAFEPARIKFDDAQRQLSAAGSPVAELAALHRGLVSYRLGRLDEALNLMTALLPRASSAPSASLYAQVESNLGLLAANQLRYTDALAHYERAREAFGKAQELTRVGFLDGLIATQYEMRGDSIRAWTTRLRALENSPREGTWLAAADAALKSDWPHVAALLQGAAARQARAQSRWPQLADSLRTVAMTRALIGDHAAATAALAEAETVALNREGAAWERIRAEIAGARAEAEGLPEGNVPAGLAAADVAIEYFTRTNQAARIPTVHLAKARLLRRKDDSQGARHELQAGLAIYRSNQEHLPGDAARATIGDVVRRIADELALLEIAADRPMDALIAIDQAKALDLAAPGADVRTVADLQQSLPSHVTIIEFMVTKDRTFLWAVRQDDHVFREVLLNREQLSRLVRAAAPPLSDNGARRALRDALLSPLDSWFRDGDSVGFVADGPLHALPFASLPGRQSTYLVEERAVFQTPSLTAWSHAGTSRMNPSSRALVVGDPAFDPSRFPGLRPLPGARVEAQQVAQVYGPAAFLLVGPQATRAAFTRDIRNASVLHFAGHAIANVSQPGASVLAIGDRGDNGVSASDVRSWELANLDLVVLSACQGTTGTRSESEGPLGLARAFLAAGARTVMANLWLVDDALTPEMMADFHRALAKSGDAARALQAIQIAAIHHSNPARRAPMAWSGFVVFTLGSQTLAGA